MASQFQDLDLQDIQFLMETASREFAQSDALTTGRRYYRPDAHDHLFDDVDVNDDPTVVMTASIDMQRAFPLINKVLPFEACLYHCILPLYIQGNELYLGMVDLEDTEALDYARKMLNYLKYQLVPQTISTETHRQVLSAFLQQQAQREQTPALPASTSKQDLATHTGDPTTAVRQIIDAVSASAHPQQAVTEPLAEATPASASTDSEDTIAQAITDATASQAAAPDETVPAIPQTLHLRDQDVLTDWQILQQASAANSELSHGEAGAIKPTFLISDGAAYLISDGAANRSPVTDAADASAATEIAPACGVLPASALPGSALPELLLKAAPLDQDWHSIAGDLFIHSLLIRMMGSGVGRLFLVRKLSGGQVLWTENGQTKLVIEQIAADQFRGAIDELKNLTHLPLETVQQPVEVEIERFYQRQRVLLRLRITPKEHGEEATIQVLRGAALKFYQKHQINSLRRDTTEIAQELRQKVLELGKRTQTSDMDRSTLPEIDRTIASLEEQLTELRKLRQNLKGESAEDLV